MSRMTVAFFLAAAPLVAADPPKELQGGWRLVAVETEAGPTELPEAKPCLVIQGDKVRHGGQEVARLTADPAAEPKLIDLQFAGPERTYEGVYLVEKDTLKLCLNGQAAGVKERPTGFALDGHPAWRRLTFERIKPADATPGPAFVGLALKFEETTKEVVVQAALDGSPAKAAGLQKDDVVLTIGGNTFDTLRGAVGLVRAARPGGELIFKVRRDGKDVEVKVKPTIVPFAGLVGLE
jgi:uncharacterized protein (TIGR03067 family)